MAGESFLKGLNGFPGGIIIITPAGAIKKESRRLALEAVKVFDDLYLFSSYLQPIDLTFNQFLLTGEEPLLVHTGGYPGAAGLAAKVKELLKGQSLRYIFISHFESDECGGLKIFLEQFPGVRPVCSMVTSRQLSGFGITDQALAQNPGQSLSLGKYQLQFINYPSEAHLWEGLLALETSRGILFSSDLFIRRGGLKEAVIKANWPEEVQKIAVEQVSSPPALEKLKQTLLSQPTRFVAPGHGPCLQIT